MNGLEGRILTLVKDLEEEKRLADKRAKQLYLAGASFIGHDDTPAAYAGQAGKFIKVNAVPDALEFVTHDVALHDALNINADRLDGVHAAALVSTAYNSSLNTDSRNSRGPTRLYRRESDTDYSVQTYWTGTYWILKGYGAGDVLHASCQVAYADNSNTVDGLHGTQFLRKDTSDTSTGRITANAGLSSGAGMVNYINGTIDSIGTYNLTTTNPATLRVLSNGLFKRYTSSQKFKSNITDLEIDPAVIYKLRPVSFTSKCKGDDRNRKHGLIAEEVEAVSPGLVDYDEEGKADNYSGPAIMALILAETQRHEERIDALEAKLNN